MTNFREQLRTMLREQAWTYNGIIDRIKFRLAVVERVAWLQSEDVLWAKTSKTAPP